MPHPDVDSPEYTDAQWDARFDPYRDVADEVGDLFVDWRILLGKQSEAQSLYVPDEHHYADSRHRLDVDVTLRDPPTVVVTFGFTASARARTKEPHQHETRLTRLVGPGATQ
ncbi:hypothetical protein [Rhodococcus sp. NCIMB 12038]|uniref:hypothetical protein n=1 Tax=Rhodococcus sp. NCIMB 12038 TaxID=933800 RepID=UPI000B3BEF4C|nr:hypothetical protein [Rhodococcus sp. NCIMB 12038]OUS91931.1 hypothetical protein CA951_31165 [Rhodococcus sp. NCIMB 12038]